MHRVRPHSRSGRGRMRPQSANEPSRSAGTRECGRQRRKSGRDSTATWRLPFQAVLNAFIQVDNAMDPMQPNVSASKAADLLTAAGRLVPQDNDSVSFQLRTLMITAHQIFDPHASPNIPVQRERFRPRSSRTGRAARDARSHRVRGGERSRSMSRCRR